MPLYLFNTLTKKKEEFKPLEPEKVRMYNCGPTVYNYAHIGNLRAVLFVDLLRRALELSGYEVTQVMNITDVGHLSGDNDDGEDKMTNALRREGKAMTLQAMKEIGEFYTQKFMDDLARLHVKTDNTKFPRASEHISEQIKLIQKLEQKELTYRTDDGVYFDTSKISDYGKLGGVSREASVARIEMKSGKKSPRDFALWKFSDTGKDELGWQSLWGVGFPGWHIECSAMAMKYLGETFDIHTGGVDHIPIHHNNEIAQSENATGKPFAHYWLHNAFLNIRGEKIAKSVGNALFLHNLRSPLAYRYLILGATYRTQIDYTDESYEAAENAYKKFIKEFSVLPKETGAVSESYKKDFDLALADDLNTPQALALAWQLLKDKSVRAQDKRATLLYFDQIFGFNLEAESEISAKLEIPSKIEVLAKERDKARAAKDFKEADEIRLQIEKNGYMIEDTPEGTRIVSAP